MVVLCGTAAPVLLKWFVKRDVSTGAPSFNVFPLLVYLHSRNSYAPSTEPKVESWSWASRPILLPYIIWRSSSKNRARNASFPFVPLLHFLLLESKGDLSYLESFCGVLCLLFFRTLFSLPRDRSTRAYVHSTIAFGFRTQYGQGALFFARSRSFTLTHFSWNFERRISQLTMFPRKRYFFLFEKRRARLKWLYIQIYLRIYMLRLEQEVPEQCGRYTTLMKLTFIFCSRSLRILLKKEKLHWNRESREVNDLEGISKKLRRLFLELFHKQIFPSTPITSFSLFLSYIVITPLMIGFEKDFYQKMVIRR
ncbi:hypothetical protein MKW92_033042 [Papaver armeniacum]|nr:hypothetical protein MKW92_033042 [Papaver armeniacum]